MTIKKLKVINLAGFKLVVSSAGVGNVGQLTCDLFIEILMMEKAGMMHSDIFTSMLGAPAFNHSEISTAAEFFVNESLKLIVLQVRTPISLDHYEIFSQEIVDFVKCEGIEEIVILSSTYSHEQRFVDKCPYEYVSNKKINFSSLNLFNETSALDKRIPGSGAALSLFEKATENDVQATILYKYSSEGDNRPDAYGLLMKVNEYLNKPITENDQIREPISWKFLFGCNVNPELY